MTDNVLDHLELLLLALFYLFFGRVLWAVWSETRAAARPKQSVTSATPTLPTRLLDIVTGAEWPLAHDTFIGRDPGCAIHLDDPSVSSRHARITIVEGQPFVTDLGSTNGTRVNGQLIDTPHPLAAGDLITIGTISVEARP
jgi:pSer/pThr/pTyr-binding forkhead associated (FHA) protein